MAKKNKPQFYATKHDTKLKNQFVTPKVGFYDEKPTFSFEHYQHAHQKYSAICIQECEDFHTMFDRLKSMSKLTWKDILEAQHIYHFHPVEWISTSERNGFKLMPSELNEVPAWQFKLFKECRIFGFFNQKNIFELVWIDRDHKVYPRK